MNSLSLLLIPLLAVSVANALTVGGGCQSSAHVSDGAICPGEWTGPLVSVSFFATPDAYLYVAQGNANDNTIYLAYDYVGGASSGPSSFFDVFFEVVPTGTDYLVRLHPGGALQAYEKPIGVDAPLDPVTQSFLPLLLPWSPILSGDPDLSLAQFVGNVTFGPSPNSSTPHPIAEFQLSINRTGGSSGAGGPGDGLYSPDPAFWSASEKSATDPPISSGIFSLPLPGDGPPIIVPLTGPGGAPIQQDSVVPEPATMWFLLSGGIGLAALRRARKA